MMSSRCLSMLARAPVLTLVTKKSPSLMKLASSRTLTTSVARLSSAASDLKDLGRDYKPDKLDKFILKRYGPKGKYSKTTDIPDQVTRQEMESAKSKFRVEINIYAMIACVLTAAWLIYFARSDQVKHNEGVVERQKADKK